MSLVDGFYSFRVAEYTSVTLLSFGKPAMLASVFTPTHNPSHLRYAFDSLKRQTHKNWEWLIVPNGPAIGKIPAYIQKDSRVRVINYLEDNRGIGALKLFACQHAEGDVFCELDHDDQLVPSVLERVVAKVEDGAGFIFSDAAVFLPEKGNESVGYSENSGWETYDFRVYGRPFVASRNFPVTPRSLCEVYYAPDHIRCWTRETYAKVGGHDPELKVGDDHDLICRTYIGKHTFAHTGSCGYLYRNYAGNTVKLAHKDIKKQQDLNRNKYIHRLVDEWCRREKHEFLDLAKFADLISVKDRKLVFKAEANTYGCIRAWDVFQFIPQPLMLSLMNELYRVLIPGGWLCVAVPSADGPAAYAPHSKSYWSTFTFEHFCRANLAVQMSGLLCRFQLARCNTDYPDKEHRKRELKYVYADLCALKGQRQPGRVLI